MKKKLLILFLSVLLTSFFIMVSDAVATAQIVEDSSLLMADQHAPAQSTTTFAQPNLNFNPKQTSNVSSVAAAPINNNPSVANPTSSTSIPSGDVAEPLTGAAPIPGPYELYGLLMCNRPGYHCVAVRPGNNWYQLFPDKKQREVVMRLNRTNVDLKYRHWLVVPDSFANLNFMDLSPVPRQMDTHGEKLLLIDLDVYAFGAYDEKGNLIDWGPTSGGADYCPEMHGPCRSVAGTFRIYRVQGPDCTSSEYPIATAGGAPMPWCMHYFRGYAIHASTLSGFANRSRGCVRLFYDDAEWLNQHFIKVGTRVIVRQKPLPGQVQIPPGPLQIGQKPAFLPIKKRKFSQKAGKSYHAAMHKQKIYR